MSITTHLVREMHDDLVDLRRQLHRVPEIGLRLPQTKALVLEALAGLPLEIHEGDSLDSVVAVVRGAKGESGPVVILRGDMDALPVQEETGLPFASEVPGVMHACGHDLHVAALVGAARLLCRRREELSGDVVLMFQPAEEGPGGAEPMIAEGLLDIAGRRADAAYAWHIAAAGYPLGTWFGNRGTTMASSEDIHVVVHGAGGHGSQPWDALDPVPVAAEIVLALQSAVTRSFDVTDPVVATVGRLAAGTKANIIPDRAELDITCRALSEEARQRLRVVVERVATGVAAAHGLTATTEVVESYPPTVNDEAEHDLACQVIDDLFGAGTYVERPAPEMGAEDFSFVMEQVPGAYLYLSGCSTDDPATAPDNHSPRAEFDDSVLWQAAAWLAETALRRCALTA